MERKAFPIFDLKVEDERVVKGIFAVHGNVDQGRDRILNGAWKRTLEQALPAGRVKVLWQHDAQQPPIGVPLDVKELSRAALPPAVRSAYPDATGGLYGEWRALGTPRGDEVLTGIKAGAITENSIGYDPVQIAYTTSEDGPVRDLKEMKLFDISPVNWGMNPATTNLKAAIPFKSAPMADPDTAWDGPGVMKQLDGADELRMACAWVDSNGDPDVKSSYKLPHHTPDGKVVWKGVAAAMARLLQEGTQIPDADRHGVYTHLAGHYKQFDKDVPDFKFAQFVWATREVQAQFAAADLKVGRSISQATQARIQQHTDTMKDHIAQMVPHMTGINESIDALTNWIAGNAPDTDVEKSAGGKAMGGTPYKPEPYDQEDDEHVECPACDKMNDDDAVNCDQCGAMLKGKTVTVDGKEVDDYQPDPYHAEPDETVKCPKCDMMNAPDARYCDHCGVKLVGRTDVMAPKAAPVSPTYTTRIDDLSAWFTGLDSDGTPTGATAPLTPVGGTGQVEMRKQAAPQSSNADPAPVPLGDDVKQRLAELDSFFTP